MAAAAVTAGRAAGATAGAGHRSSARAHLALATMLLAVAACSRLPPAEQPPPPPAPLIPPPPGGSVNLGLGSLEAVWHVRSALNVAALSCGGGVAADYNRFLAQHRPLLDRAFKDEEGRHAGGARLLDTHMTRVYNYFAWPPAQTGFCASATSLAPRVTAMPEGEFLASAPTLLAGLDAAFTGPMAPTPAPTSAPASRTSVTTLAARAAPPAAASSSGPSRRIQLGAFSGTARAQAAWTQISAKAADIARLQPRYQDVPGRPGLVRLQTDRPVAHAQAIRLCALAAAAGFDCFTVAG